MNRNDFNDLVVEPRLQLIKSVLAAKGDEYSGGKDAFHNFKASVGISFHEIPEKVAWEFMTKHIRSIMDMLNDIEKGKIPTEAYSREKIGDGINYLILIEGMITERQIMAKQPLITQLHDKG